MIELKRSMNRDNRHGSRRLIIAYKPGQLSNRLLPFTTFVVVSARSGIRVFNPSFGEYASYFEATQSDLLCRCPPRASWLPRGRRVRRAAFRIAYYAARVLVRLGVSGRRVRVITLGWPDRLHPDAAFLPDIADAWVGFSKVWRIFVPPNRDVELSGPPGGIEPQAELLRKCFRPLESYRHRAESLAARARQSCDLLIGAHIRQSDFLTGSPSSFSLWAFSYGRTPSCWIFNIEEL